MIPTRTFDFLDILKTHFPKDDIFARVVDGKWLKVSVDDYIESSWNVAAGLMAKGYQPNDKIVVVCNNCPEWNFLDMGCTLARLVFIPIYQTLSPDEFSFVFDHSDASLIIIGNKSLYQKLAPIIAGMKHHADIMTIDDKSSGDCFGDLMDLGKHNREQFNPIIEKNKKEISPDEVASIIYTSGTTGASKGVMLTHRNLTFNSYTHALLQTAGQQHKMLSFLPLCHAYERTMNYEFQQLGISIYYAESLSTIQRDLASFHGDGFCAVPRVLELFYSKFESAAKDLKGFQRSVYKWAWRFGINYENKRKSLIYKSKHRLADRLVYSKWREALGGHEMWIVSGGSAIRPNITRLFTAAKLNIYQGYGMTEASPVIAVNPPAHNTLGTNGSPLKGTELKFGDDGEILVRGPHIMKGYYKDEQATHEIIDSEGWLHTGDIGYLKDDRYLMITDRKKEIFKLSSGKYIAPQVIENKLHESPYIENALVFGEHQKFASAIIIIQIKAIRAWLEKNGHKPGYSNEALLNDVKVMNLLNKEISKTNKCLADYEKLRRCIFVTDAWTVENGMLSQTLKPKRKIILSNYQDRVKSVYEAS